MQTQLRFDGKVAIITGAGAGLGRAYAHLLGERGAKVVVNDLGTSKEGVKAADIVVAEIKKAGGIAVANYDSVEFGDKIVKTAVDAFGTVDIVVNNAGILRDVSFMKMKEEDWDIIMKVHLKGTFSVTKAAWNIMRSKGYGRIINTGSSSGIFGSFGQANYAAAKMAMHGFTQTLAKEGGAKGIMVNTIAPVAGTQMTATVMPKEQVDALKPEFVAPLVAVLAHETCPENGSLFEVAAGYICKDRWSRSNGVLLPPDQITPENVAANWSKIVDFSNQTYPTSSEEFFVNIVANLEKVMEKNKSLGSNKTAGGLKSDEIFQMMSVFLGRGEGKELVPKVQAVFAFNILKVKGGPVEASFEIDLKNGQGLARKGKPEKADATFTMTDEDFENVCLGKLNPQMAFMQGKMKIQGNMGKATKFTPDLFPPPTAENMAKYKEAKL